MEGHDKSTAELFHNGFINVWYCCQAMYTMLTITACTPKKEAFIPFHLWQVIVADCWSRVADTNIPPLESILMPPTFAELGLKYKSVVRSVQRNFVQKCLWFLSYLSHSNATLANHVPASVRLESIA